MILSDEEIAEISLSAVTVKDAIADVRAVEAAILAKLASAELPEPSIFQYDAMLASPIKAYTADQLRQAYAQGAAEQLSSEPIAHCRVLPLQSDEYTPKSIVQWANHPVDGPLYTRRQA